MAMAQNTNTDPPEPVSISALNDFLYCNRRCALHRLEEMWVDNVWTVTGTLAHEIADDPGYRQTAEGARIERALPLFSEKLGLIGKADIVEFWPSPQAGGRDVPLPVDYKLGKRRKWDNDDVQLCAQALCLEEMVGVAVPRGAIYHVKTRRRREVEFTESLRQLTLETIENVRALLLADVVPPAELKPQCEGCSVHAICVPELPAHSRALDSAYARLFAADG
jgi:CRISPR-associated exonuclease Cas4